MILQAKQMPETLTDSTALSPPREQPARTFTTADWAVIASLLLIEFCCFGVMAKSLGFYLDDWATICQLHFAPHDFVSVLRASLADPRMVTRPIQCVYYACTYMLFGDVPLGYHIVRCILEFAGASFLYAGLRSAMGRRLPAAISAILFTLFPSHDASHYWIGAGLGAGFGSTLYLLSFWLAVASARSRKILPAVLSNLVFLLCAYCYEAFLPMLSLTFFAVLFVELQRAKFTTALLTTSRFLLPSLLIGGSEPIYQRVVVPMFSKVFLSPGTFSPAYALDVLGKGLAISLGPAGWTFFADRAREALSNIKTPEIIRLGSTAAACILSLYFASRKDSVVSQPRSNTTVSFMRESKDLLYWSCTAVIVLLCSYLTFAVAEGYTPVLSSMLNRVNMGASIAAAILFGILIAPGKSSIKSNLPGAIALTTVLALFYSLVNFGFAPQWLQSWTVQKSIRNMVVERAPKVASGDTILLANTPRYVMWAPVFDGVWDFQSMVWMTLNNRNINGGVVCERLDVQPQAIYDKSAGFLCATYKYANLNVLIPNGNRFIAVTSPEQFISTIESSGMDFGLPASKIKQWRATSSVTAPRQDASPQPGP